MIAALYSKDPTERNNYIAEFARTAPGATIHIYPKNMARLAAAMPGTYAVTYEDLTKRDNWLQVNSLLGAGTSLILENPARYPKATTPKSRALRRLSMQVERKAIIDIVPFTVDVQYLYTPLSYLSREILGYAHNYAFRENYQEMGDDGVIRFAHDPAVLAAKMQSVCRITYPQFLCPHRQLIQIASTPVEREKYAQRKAELFAAESNPGRIVTRLADTAHAFTSRTEALLQLAASIDEPILALCNLNSYAKRLQAAARAAKIKNLYPTTYQLGSDRVFECVAYFESPIVNSYYLLDIEAALPETARVYHFLSDNKVDQFLYGRLQHELTQINDLTKELYAVSRRTEAARP